MTSKQAGVAALIFALITTVTSVTQDGAPPTPAEHEAAPHDFKGVEQWQTALKTNNVPALTALYSTDPKFRSTTPQGDVDAAADIKFWTDLKATFITVQVLQTATPQPDSAQAVLQVLMQSAAHNNQNIYVTLGQLWQRQGNQWKLVASKRTDVAQQETVIPAGVLTGDDIYPATADAHTEIKEALEQAEREHKRVILVFGANWCYDCHVLDKAFHRNDIAPLLKANFEVVHIDIGEGNKNQDLMKQYDVPMSKGIPALAVLDSNGKLLFSQKEGQFENARSLAPAAFTDFLNKWKPQAH